MFKNYLRVGNGHKFPVNMYVALNVIRIQTGTHSRSENGRIAWDALYDTTP
jgi:hypothetical protein